MLFARIDASSCSFFYAMYSLADPSSIQVNIYIRALLSCR